MDSRRCLTWRYINEGNIAKIVLCQIVLAEWSWDWIRFDLKLRNNALLMDLLNIVVGEDLLIADVKLPDGANYTNKVYLAKQSLLPLLSCLGTHTSAPAAALAFFRNFWALIQLFLQIFFGLIIAPTCHKRTYKCKYNGAKATDIGQQVNCTIYSSPIYESI